MIFCQKEANQALEDLVTFHYGQEVTIDKVKALGEPDNTHPQIG